MKISGPAAFELDPEKLAQAKALLAGDIPCRVFFKHELDDASGKYGATGLIAGKSAAHRIGGPPPSNLVDFGSLSLQQAGELAKSFGVELFQT